MLLTSPGAAAVGLTSAEVAIRRSRDRRNIIPAPRKAPVWCLLGGAWPSTVGWLFCLLAAVAMPLVDAGHKQWHHVKGSR